MRKSVQTLERPDEQSLIARAIRRDPEAIRAITTAHNRRLYRIARGILGNDDEAEDALQTAYLRAFSALANFRQDSSLGTWLTRIVMNESLGRIRSRKSTISYDEENSAAANGQVIAFPGVAAAIDPERAMAQRQIREAMEKAIDELPEIFRTVLVARVIEEMSLEETAALLDLRVETVKTRLYRARRLLRLALERRIGPVMMDAFPFGGRRCERMTETVLKLLKLQQ